MKPLKSINYYKNILENQPTNSDVTSLLAFAYMNEGDYDSALFWFKETVRLNPNTKNLNNLGWFLLEEYGVNKNKCRLSWKERITEAIKILEIAIALSNANYNQPYFALAFAYYQINNTVKAKENIEKAIAIKQDYFSNNFLAILMFEFGEIEEAAKWFLLAYQLQPEQSKIHDAYYWYVFCLQKLGKVAKAQEVALVIKNIDGLKDYLKNTQGIFKFSPPHTPEISTKCNFIECPVC